jgi:hypothetical protein
MTLSFKKSNEVINIDDCERMPCEIYSRVM